MPKSVEDDQYSPEETARRSEELLKHMLNRPPQPRATYQPGQRRNQKPTVSGQAAQNHVVPVKP